MLGLNLDVSNFGICLFSTFDVMSSLQFCGVKAAQISCQIGRVPIAIFSAFNFADSLLAFEKVLSLVFKFRAENGVKEKFIFLVEASNNGKYDHLVGEAFHLLSNLLSMDVSQVLRDILVSSYSLH